MRMRTAALLGAIAGALMGATCGEKLYAQVPTETQEIRVTAGTWFIAARAFSMDGLQSGLSNEVVVTCAPVAPAVECPTRLHWDANGETNLAGYVLVWGPATGVYSRSATFAPTVTPVPGRLPAPTLRLRR
jgi:hypothetical protein